MSLLSSGVLNEWYLLGTILNYRLGMDNTYFYLIFFLRMAHISWQKILKGRVLKKVKEALTASSKPLFITVSAWSTVVIDFLIYSGLQISDLVSLFCRQSNSLNKAM